MQYIMQANLFDLAKTISKLHTQANFMISTAESCTGGQLAFLLTSISGSSRWFDRGFVTYSNEAKQDNLDVSLACLQQYGAVSKETAIAMAEGALAHSNATVSVVTTGIAGPEGGSIEKPVGTVWVALASKDQPAYAKHFLFSGDRLAVRDKTCEQALLELIKTLQKS